MDTTKYFPFYELVIATCFIVIGAASKPISILISQWMVGHMDCAFMGGEDVISQTINAGLQKSCDLVEYSLEWSLYFPIILVVYRLSLWGFVNALLAAVINVLFLKGKYYKIFELLSPKDLVLFSTVATGVICLYTPLDDWFKK